MKIIETTTVTEETMPVPNMNTRLRYLLVEKKSPICKPNSVHVPITKMILLPNISVSLGTKVAEIAYPAKYSDP